MATEKDEKQIEKAAEKSIHKILEQQIKEDQVADLMDALEKGESEGPTVDPFEENTQDSAEKDRENLERILDELATKPIVLRLNWTKSTQKLPASKKKLKKS